ncbi:MAG: hypothetical protein IH855_08680 [Bacteroidetes bacterium]|nr:hypothetical protein [Bacteroidota bacterium]
MQELIGHIAATMIAGVIILILAVVAWRGQHHSVSSEQYSAAKQGVLDLVQVFEEDFSNMGAGRTNATLKSPTGYGAFFSASSFNVTAAPYSVRFYAWTDRTTAIDPEVDYTNNVEYRWDATGTTRIYDPVTNTYVTIPTYTIERFVNGIANGSSIDSITDVSITLYNSSGTEITPTDITADPLLLNQVYAVQISIRAVSPLGGGQGYRDQNDAALRYEVEETRWSRMFRPVNLARVSV